MRRVIRGDIHGASNAKDQRGARLLGRCSNLFRFEHGWRCAHGIAIRLRHAIGYYWRWASGSGGRGDHSAHGMWSYDWWVVVIDVPGLKLRQGRGKTGVRGRKRERNI